LGRAIDLRPGFAQNLLTQPLKGDLVEIPKHLPITFWNLAEHMLMSELSRARRAERALQRCCSIFHTCQVTIATALGCSGLTIILSHRLSTLLSIWAQAHMYARHGIE